MKQILIIRKGTEPNKRLLNKIIKHIWNNVLYNSRNLKVEKTLYVEVRQ